MTVAELIAKLQEMPQDMQVLIETGMEGGLGELSEPAIIEVAYNVNDTQFFGPHSDKMDLPNWYPEGTRFGKAVVIV